MAWRRKAIIISFTSLTNTLTSFRMFLSYKENLTGGLNSETLDLARKERKQRYYIPKQAHSHTWPQRCSTMS
jgi:hypothetical protein